MKNNAEMLISLYMVQIHFKFFQVHERTEVTCTYNPRWNIIVATSLILKMGAYFVVVPATHPFWFQGIIFQLIFGASTEDVEKNRAVVHWTS